MILAPPQSPDLQAQFQSAMQGVLRRPGKGRRKGQWVLGQGEFSGLSEDEVYGRLRARQGGNSGSGPGGGLRSGGLGGSGIDYVKRGMPSNGSITPDPIQATTAPPPVKLDPMASAVPSVLLRKIGSTDAENPAEDKAEGGIEEVGPPESAAPVTPNTFNAFGSSFKDAQSSKGMSVRANDPLSPTPVPPVLQKPAASPIKTAGANQIAPIVADTSALGNGEAPQKNPFAKKPLDNRLTAGLASNKRDKFSNKNPFV